MYCLRTLSLPLLLLLLLQSSQSSAQSTKSAVTTAASSSAIPPSCIQSRAPTASSAAAIQSSIASDNTLSKACDAPTQQWVSVSGTTKIYYALDSAYFFNISLAAGVTSAPPSQDCTNNFNTILSSCVMSRNFWGGWIVSNGMNYSINHTPASPVSSAASSISASSMGSNAPASSASSTLKVSSASLANSAGVAGSASSSSSAGSSRSENEAASLSSGLIPSSSFQGTSVTANAASPASTTNSGSSGSSASSISSISSLSSVPAPSVYVFDGVTFTSGPSGLVAGTATVHPGGTAVTVSSHTFSLGPLGSSIAVDGTVSPLTQGITKILNAGPSTSRNTLASTSALSSVSPANTTASSHASSAAIPPATSVYTFDGIAFTSVASGLIAGTITMKPGGPAVTISSHVFSLGSLGSTVAVDGTLSPLKPAQVASTTDSVSISSGSAKSSVYTFDGITFTSGTSGLVAGTVTVQAGGPAVTISSHTFSLGPAGSTIAVDGILSPLTPSQPVTTNPVVKSKSSASFGPSITPPPPPVYTVDGIAITGNPSSALTIAGSRITPGGPPAIISSRTFSIPTAATSSAIYVDGTLTRLSIPTATSSASPGSTKSANSARLTSGPSSMYTIDSVIFTGNPTSLATANWTLTAGGSAMTISSHTFQIPALATGGAISVDGTLTTLPSPGAIGTRSSRASTASSASSTSSRGSSASSQSAITPYTFAVTATDTAIPAGFYAQTSSNADWRSNTWLTTTDKTGHTTIVLVLVGCKVCGGIGGGIILWGLPPIPDISFSFPKFNLPSFSLPCIPIFLIKSCNSPGDAPETDVDDSIPGTDPNKPNPNDPDGNPDEEEPDEEKKTQEQQSEEKQTQTKPSKSTAPSSITPSSTTLSSTTLSSTTPSSSATSASSCVLIVYSLTPFTDLATLETGGITTFGSMTSSGTATSASSCVLTVYSLTPFTDLATLDTGGISTFGSLTSSGTTTNASSCILTVYSLTPFTDLATLVTDDSTDTASATATATATASASVSATATATATATSTQTTTAASSCLLTVYSLTPFTDLATLDTDYGPTLTPTTTPLSITSTPASTPPPDCTAITVSWFSPTVWCQCGKDQATYAALPSSSGASANCDLTALPSTTINPISVKPGPTNVPGVNGLDGCNAVDAGDEQGCPGVDYCNCNEVYVGFLTATVSGTASRNCDYKIQPTANDCPVNTLALLSASVSASKAAVAPSPTPSPTTSTFNSASTTLSCGAKFSTDSGAIYTSIPRAQTNQVLANIVDFCTPSDNGVGDTLTLVKGKPAYHTMRFDAPGLMLYQFEMVWDPRPECANIPAPEIRDAVPTGPDYWCQVYFDAITNSCDAGAGEDKHGGIMYADCVIWAWEAFDGCSGEFAKENNCP